MRFKLGPPNSNSNAQVERLRDELRFKVEAGDPSGPRSTLQRRIVGLGIDGVVAIGPERPAIRASERVDAEIRRPVVGFVPALRYHCSFRGAPHERPMDIKVLSISFAMACTSTVAMAIKFSISSVSSWTDEADLVQVSVLDHVHALHSLHDQAHEDYLYAAQTSSLV